MNDLKNIKIERFFYPIGQGAFYAEKHKVGDDTFTIVYDCGSTAPKKADIIIEKAFKDKEVIDILFISHFDSDHVNKIKKLKEYTKIKNVVMPLLQEEDIYLLKNMYRVLGLHFFKLLNSPENFFDKETKIIKIKSTNSLEPNIDPSNNIIDLDNLNNFIQDSGIAIRKKNLHYDWIFIPYNHKKEDRSSQLEIEFKKVGLDIEKLKKDKNYTINLIEKDSKKIKKIYQEINGTINENSMLLYSGVLVNNSNNFTKESYLLDLDKDIKWHGILKKTDRVSCVYTGDADLNIVKIKKIFRDLWKTIGTIQIPHHGDEKSFDNNVLDDENYFCPISVGKNSYKHPSKKLVEDIISKNSYPILVSGDLSSGFIECINNEIYINNRLEKLGCLKHLLYLK